MQIIGLVDTNLPTNSFPEYVGTWLQPNEVLQIPYTLDATDAGIIFNWAEVVVADNEENTARVGAEQTVWVTDVLPTVTLAKTVDKTSLPEPGGVFNYTLTITNTSVEQVVITDLFDSQYPEAGGYVTWTLAPGEVLEIPYPVTHTQAGTYPNTASVAVMDNELNSATAVAIQSVTVLPPVTFTIAASAGANGSITPVGDVTVSQAPPRASPSARHSASRSPTSWWTASRWSGGERTTSSRTCRPTTPSRPASRPSPRSAPPSPSPTPPAPSPKARGAGGLHGDRCPSYRHVPHLRLQRRHLPLA